MDYTPAEMMAIAAARALSNEDVCFVGIGAPSTACNLARLTHAPDITLIYESGTIAARPDALPLSIGDPELSETALTTVSVPEMFAVLAARWAGLGGLSGRRADRPLRQHQLEGHRRLRASNVRLPGAGGAPEIASACGRIFVIMAQSPRSFVPALISSPRSGMGRGR